VLPPSPETDILVTRWGARPSGGHKAAGARGGAGQVIRPRRLCPAPGAPRLEARSARLSGAREGPSPRPARGPDPAEPGSAWGEFEGFRDASAQSEQFSPNLERPERPPRPRRQTVASTQKERGARQPAQRGPGVPGAAGSPPHSSEDVFSFVFQDTPVPQATEGVSPLNHILEAPGWESGQQLCPESRRLWRALQSPDGASASRCPWSGSHCQENLFLVLGIDAAQKNPSGDLGHTLECSDLKQPEDLGAPAFSLQPCRAVIQTKLPGTSGGRQGGLLACSVFLKTPLPRNGQYITIPWKKKMFNPRKLKMTLFNSDVC
uniref:Aftiphilin clathrin-binding box domain-containing protein n=1 Tax=Neovison vison TaxID=452646 RepID=A0A8C7AL09_NEOVI